MMLGKTVGEKKFIKQPELFCSLPHYQCPLAFKNLPCNTEGGHQREVAKHLNRRGHTQRPTGLLLLVTGLVSSEQMRPQLLSAKEGECGLTSS